MSDKLSRLGIFVFFDPQGIVDEYVVYLLRSLRPHFSRMIVVSNSALEQTAQARLLQHADDLFLRENQGLDAAAYKAGLVTYCGWDEAAKYDEVVLINDTFFGPIGSFDPMFSEMAKRDVDFWGMSAGYHSPDGWDRVKYHYIPDHIQTFFVAFRKNMVCSEAFRSYWENYDDTMNDFISVVSQHEVVMTKYFQDRGFRWDIYADTQRYRFPYHSENFNLYHFHPHTMIRDMKFPVLKKKTLNIDIPAQLRMQDLEASADALEYIHKETDYDTKLIWDNVLRLYNVTDLYHSLHLNYVLPSVQRPIPESRKVALVYRILNPFFAEQFCVHAKANCRSADVYLIPESEDIKAIIGRHIQDSDPIRLLPPSRQKTPMGSFVLCCREFIQQYDYIGFVHDAVTLDHDPVTVAESQVYGFLQNTANDPAYLSQILGCFEDNPRLGVLGTPFPIHHYGFGNYGNEWGGCFENVRALSSELGLKCNLAEDKRPFMVTSAFWCRSAAVRCLWNKEWNTGHFLLNPVTNSCKTNEVLSRILPYLAQSEGYYSALVMHTSYASARLTGQQYMLDEIISTTRRQLGCRSPRFKGYLEQLQSIRPGDPCTPMTIDLSRFGTGAVFQMLLERKAPHWFTRKMYQFYQFIKNPFFRK